MSLFGNPMGNGFPGSSSSEAVSSEENSPFGGGPFGNNAGSNLPNANPFSNSQPSDSGPGLSNPFGGSLPESVAENPPVVAESIPEMSHPFGGSEPEMSHPFGESIPESAAENPPSVGESWPEMSHPFGESEPEMSHPFGESLPESAAENPASVGESWPEMSHPFGESEPEGERPFYGTRPEAEPRFTWIDACKREANPFGEPFAEPEGYPEAGPYAEPPAPLLQPSNTVDRGTYSTFAAVVATLIITLNIAVLVVLLRKPKQRKSLTYLIGLTAAFDMLGGLQFLWFSSFDVHLMFTHADMWIIVMCGIWMLTMAPQISALMHFGLHLLDELNVGVNNAKISVGRIIFIVLTVFVLPVALFIPPLAGWNCIGCNNPDDDLYYCQKKCSMAIFPFAKIYVLLMVILLFVAMVIVISIYAMIYATICRRRCERKLSPKSGKADVIRLTFSILIVYLLCVIPVSIVMIFDYISIKCNPEVINAFHATLFVSFLSNLLNPIIVFSSLPSMRDAISSNHNPENGNLLMKKISNSSTGKSEVNGAYDIDEKPPLEDDIPTEV